MVNGAGRSLKPQGYDSGPLPEIPEIGNRRSETGARNRPLRPPILIIARLWIARIEQAIAELKAAIDEWIEHRNQDPKPFTWTTTAKTILVKHRRAKKVLAKAGCK